MRVLILSYYWPPAGGSGVQRWLKFVKYLPSNGIEPVVYTVDQANYPILDPSLSTDIPNGVEVLKQPIKEPNSLLAKFRRNKQTSAGFLAENPTFLGKIALYIRANYFIPDARKYWIKPSVRFLTEYLKNNPVDLIITSGPPHSLHLIAKQLKERLGVKWIADFRDPWTQIDYFHQLPLTNRSLMKHQQLEESVVKEADHIIVVGNQMKQQYLNFTSRISVITNGFDDVTVDDNLNLDETFSIVHIGMLNADRNPHALWQALVNLKEKRPDLIEHLNIKLIGKVAPEVKASLLEHQLYDQVKIISYVSHHEALQFQRTAQILLLAINKVPSAKGIITGKIFEYLQAARPILAIGPINGDLANIIEDTKAGVVCGFEEVTRIEAQLISWFDQYKHGKLTLDAANIEQYHRANLTKKLAQIIKKVVTSK